MYRIREWEQNYSEMAQDHDYDYEPDWGRSAEDVNPTTNLGAAPGTSCSGSRASRSSTPRGPSTKRPAKYSSRGARSKSPRTEDRGNMHAEAEDHSEAEESRDLDPSEDGSLGCEAGEARNRHQRTRSGRPMVEETGTSSNALLRE